ncbi:LacI family DNA-binding transcriptional regulator [Ruania halotolerans]|uniref:LacI family DNA-binding transcriptional regulator n=1 Tax=Ruania halotolerans TaxID=2897773 RepID=UPI001E311816|nr:LacI family DNA-binding transcriptional regulator [Ruania halotolerans]UFU07937.1 LacI family transcriptional regulator [Ruania halotolerans]
MGRVTIADVAKRAGVSLASTSRALNGQVASAATVEKVRKAATDLGYIPDSAARSLRTRRTGQLAFAVADVGNPVYVEMMREIESVIAAEDYRLVVSRTGDAAGTLDLVRDLNRGYVDGLILSPLRVTPALVDALEASTVPTVVIGRLPENTRVDTVMADSEGGVALAVDHLVATGARRIAFLNGPADTTPGKFRHAGFLRATAEVGGLTTAEFSAEDFTIDAGYAAAAAIFDSAESSWDAVIAVNDLVGIGVMHAAAEHGLTVPEDLAVIGIDNTTLADVCHPGLTSVDLGSARRGRKAAQMLLARMDDAGLEPRAVRVPPSLHLRGSTHALPSARKAPPTAEPRTARNRTTGRASAAQSTPTAKGTSPRTSGEGRAQ